MTFSIIKKSQLEGAMRLDAEYYQPEYLAISEKLKKLKTQLLVKVAIISTGPAYSSNEMGNDNLVPLARIGDVTRKTDIGDWISISNQEFEKFRNKKINSGDILMTMTGDPPDVGKCNIYQLSNEIVAYNQRVAKITSKINSNFLFAYLSTEFARLQCERNALGIRQRNVATDDIRNIKVIDIPENSQSVIGDVVQNYSVELKNSKKCYREAEKTLLKELGLENFETEKKLFSIVNLSNCLESNRIDAEYFQSKFADLVKQLKENKSKLLSEVVENVPAKFNPISQPEEEFDYVELSNIDSSLGTISGSSKVLGREAASRAKRILKENDVIISSVEGSLDKVALAGKDQVGFLASTGFFQFRSKEILPEVLLVLAKSIVFQYQLKQRCAGTILTAVPQDSIKNILIPILPAKIQQQIADLVRKSHTARQKSKELLDEAKRKVEEMIEGKKDEK